MMPIVGVAGGSAATAVRNRYFEIGSSLDSQRQLSATSSFSQYVTASHLRDAICADPNRTIATTLNQQQLSGGEVVR